MKFNPLIGWEGRLLCLLFSIFFNSFIFAQYETSFTSSTSGAGTWVAPCGVTSVTVELWGAGGGGAQVKGDRSAAGGGSGGGYVRATYAVQPGTTYSYSVGTGGSTTGGNGTASWFVGARVLNAVGGNGAGASVDANNTYGTGAVAPTTGNVGGNLVSTYGGNGGNANSSTSGAGGGSAGNSKGVNATNGTAGAAVINGYAGAAGVTTGGQGSVGIEGGIGAGGSGGRAPNTQNKVGGKGGSGQIRITYNGLIPSYSCVKSITTEVRPITRVSFADIDNRSTNSVQNAEGVEEFCIVGNVQRGERYRFRAESNTNGSYSMFFRVFIDWNADGDFNDANESIDAGALLNSNGLDNRFTSVYITVPTNAVLGNVKMRVVTMSGSYPSACDAQANGQAEDYIISIKERPACPQVVTGGYANASVPTTTPSTQFNLYSVGYSNGSSVSYQWQSATTKDGAWTDISGARSVNYTATSSATLGATIYYRLKVVCGGVTGYSTVIGVTSSAVNYCTPILSGNQDPTVVYFDKVGFVGAFEDYEQVSTYSWSLMGYQDFTSNTKRASQLQGNGFNVRFNIAGMGFVKAYVDWNKDGDFSDAGEEVYSTANLGVSSAAFGVSIPVDQPVGKYRMRLRVLPSGTSSTSSTACTTYDLGGEIEDYEFEVLPMCASVISNIENGENCKGGEIVLKAYAANVVNPTFKWYDSLTATSPIETNTTGVLTVSPSETKIYYVTVVSGAGCESDVRTAVTARVRPMPDLTFTLSNETADFCGDTDYLLISTAGDLEELVLVEENFESAVAAPTSTQLASSYFNYEAIKANSDAFFNWTIRESPYIPVGSVWHPVISSGMRGNKYAFMNSDKSNSGVDGAISLIGAVSTVGLTELKLDFDLYYSDYGAADYFAVEVSTDAENKTWEQAKVYQQSVGIGTKFEKISLLLDSKYLNKSTLKIRFRYSAGYTDGVAVDNIKLYGVRPLIPNFTWAAQNMSVFGADCKTPYNGSAQTVCLKPSAEQIENFEFWNVSAQASLANGCSATSSITIKNNNKIWSSSQTNWGTANWKPTSALPTADKCVIVKSPVVINKGTAAVAKSVMVEKAASLQVSTGGSLVINDVFVNQSAAGNVIVQTDASFIQRANVVNTTPITVQRALVLSAARKEYNFLSSPVADQNMKMLFGNVASNTPFATVLNEATNYYVNAAAKDYLIKAKGYAVKEPILAYTGASVGLAPNIAQFQNIPNNGAITYNLGYSSTTLSDSKQGNNVVGNPYPSNINVRQLYLDSGGSAAGVSSTFKFWDNTVNATYVQMGLSYGNYSYAMFNAATGSNGTGNPAPGGDPLNVNNPASSMKFPNRFVKVGQGFMVKATKPGAVLKFGNNQRVTNSGESYFGKKDEVEDDRYWVQMVSPVGVSFLNAIVYFEGGNSLFTEDDSEFPSGVSEGIYTVIEDREASINGRPVFDRKDKITLGYKAFEDGTYKINIPVREGVFANGQAVYLKDKVLGVTADISVSPYVFTTAKGEFNNRFELLYENDAFLGDLNAVVKDEVEIYKDGLGFRITSKNKLSAVEVYDMSGKLIHKDAASGASYFLSSEAILSGIYLIKVSDVNGKTITKKVRN